MNLADLAAYAEEKYHIREEHRWVDFPGYSILRDPYTGKWAALLMRRRDPNAISEIEICDIKCGQQILLDLPVPYLFQPFRMHGPEWVGVKIDDATDPDLVYKLFDHAVQSGEQRGWTFVLSNEPSSGASDYQDSPLPFSWKTPAPPDEDIPEKIRQMMDLYEYGDGSYSHKCKNFYVQGKFMEDYEDDAPWNGNFTHYFPKYHDLRVEQLRGYFTWRTAVRKGNFQPICTSLAYMYLYELLNDIGTDSPEDALQKMEEFQAGYIDSGIGDETMRKNLRDWMMDFAVIHDFPPETARRYADANMLRKDNALAALKKAGDHSDAEVFDALVQFCSRLSASPVIVKQKAEGEHLFAEVWRYALANLYPDGKKFFTSCFGYRQTFRWYPLGNAVYYRRMKQKETVYDLNECRRYIFRDGCWKEQSYQNLNFNKKLFSAFLREADRLLRLYLKTGHPLKERDEDAWAAPYIQKVIDTDREAKIEASRPKVTIRFSDLDQIRQDAKITRDSLLTEEEQDDSEPGIQNYGSMDNGSEGLFFPVSDLKREEPVPSEQQPDGNFNEAAVQPFSLDKDLMQVLRMLLQGGSVQQFITENHMMPSIVADNINEAFFDEIGDNILEWDGDQLSLIEDYRNDILNLIGS